MKKNAAYLWAFWALTLLNAQAAKVPAEAKKHLNYGTAALEMATDETGYQKAAVEFGVATQLAPRWPAPYYDLGVIYSKMNRFDDALWYYNRYLELSPKAKDAEKVKSEIDKLQYKKEQQSDKSRYCGEWCGVINPSTRFCDFNLELYQNPNNKTLYHLLAWCANEDDCGEDTGWSITVDDLRIGPDNKFDATGVIAKLKGENKTVLGSGRVMGSLSDKDSNGEGKDMINLGFLFRGEWYSLAFKKAGN